MRYSWRRHDEFDEIPGHYMLISALHLKMIPSSAKLFQRVGYSCLDVMIQQLLLNVGEEVRKQKIVNVSIR